ncbi:hypothetical protein Glove_22g22 [Diversispora epigaea]|uniref:PROP1-like PPR domain-containing protein n=1 Tax=Diversispora epigaea TaxID=1348612 RepID=A0A397JR76_9GLOM|nr:hypothetical protein Glove_22g22 [Diversispora epigaea]
MMEEKIDRFDKQQMTESINEIPLQEDDFTKMYESLISPLSPPPSSPSLSKKKQQQQLNQQQQQQQFEMLSAHGELEELGELERELRYEHEELSPGLPKLSRLPGLPKLPPELKLLPSAQQIKQSIGNELLPSPEKYRSLALQDYNKILYTCAMQNNVKEAEFIIKKMKEAGIEPDIHTYEQLINVYASVGNIEKSLSTFDMIDYKKLTQTVYSYGNLIKAYVNNLRTDDAFNVYSKMKTAKILPNQPIFSMLIKVCIKNGEIPRAWKTFDHMRLEVCQPDEVTYSLMIHACAKTRDAERAFDLYQEMKDKGLSPTDVTFNSLIDACAHQAFRLLNEMEDYGYIPDLFTYNSLLYACSHKGDFYTARKLFILMMQNGLRDQSLAPDDTTFTNLFWVYGVHKEQKNSNLIKNLTSSQSPSPLSPSTLPSSSFEEVNDYDDDLLIDEDEIDNNNDKIIFKEDNHDLLTIGSHVYPLLKNFPLTHKQVLIESDILFSYIISLTNKNHDNKNIGNDNNNNDIIKNTQISYISSRLFNSYLTVIEKKGQLQEVLDHYKDTIPKYNIELDGWIFLTLLNACYRHKKVEFAWSIWQDWQIWWKLKKQDLVIIQKLNNHDQRKEFKRLGLTKDIEYDTYKLMINILARCEDIWGAIRLLQKLSQNQIPKFEHFQLLRLKCLEKENELALTKLMELSYFDEGTPGTKVKELLAKKWKGINVLPGKVGRKVLQAKLNKNDNLNKFKGKIDWKNFKEGKKLDGKQFKKRKN